MRRVFALACALVPTVAAARGPEGRSIGIGVCLPEPSGFTLEAYVTHNTAIDLAVGWDTFSDRDAYGHFDYLVMPVDLARGGSVSVPIYLGLGAFLLEANSDLYFGARVPLGLAFNFRTAPLQIFGEVALRILIAAPHEPADRLDLDGDVGFRLFF
jgi:hypothetical protein